MKEAKFKAVKCDRESVTKGVTTFTWVFKEEGRNATREFITGNDHKLNIDRLYSLEELEQIFDPKRKKPKIEKIDCSTEVKRTYLTNAEAFSWGEFLHSDFRKLLKQREARGKLNAGMVDFVPWTIAMKDITKEDMKLWKFLYFEHGIRNFNNIAPILEVWNYDLR